MKPTNFLIILFGIHFPLLLYALSAPSEPHPINPYKSHDAKKHKDKDKKPPPAPTTDYNALLQQINRTCNEKVTKAHSIQNAIVRTWKNQNEVVDSLQKAAQLFDSAAADLNGIFAFITAFSNRAELERDIRNYVTELQLLSQRCRDDAKEWPSRVKAHKETLANEITKTKAECADIESKGATYQCRCKYKRLAYLLEKAIENGEPDTGDLASCQQKIVQLEVEADNFRNASGQSMADLEDFRDQEYAARSSFFGQKHVPQLDAAVAIPLDGQTSTLYTDQYYRYLIQQSNEASSLRIVVYDDGTVVHEESISLPQKATSEWNHYLVEEKMAMNPKTLLSALFDLDLRISFIKDPNHTNSIVIAQKGLSSKYKYDCYLDERLLYSSQFTDRPPWQLLALKLPPNDLIRPYQNPSLDFKTPLLPIETKFDNCKCSSYPQLNAFVEDLKRDPIALAQYVHNEIETVDPLLVQENGVFYPPCIQRSPLRTFLEKQGTPWEQCTLLAYLLQQAGFRVQFMDGFYTLPAAYMERLFSLQLPDKDQIIVKYPGVVFTDGKETYTLFPWMKDINIIEGHELYSLMPDEYSTADGFIRKYLCCDESLLKYIGPDGDDTLRFLFVRFVEEKLKSQGLSLYDVGTHRTIRKKQFFSWNDFPRPNSIKNAHIYADISKLDYLFALMKIVIKSDQNPLKKMESAYLNLSCFSCGTFGISFTPVDQTVHNLHFSFSDDWASEFDMPLDMTDHSLSIEVHFAAKMSPNVSINEKKVFNIAKGTHAAICFQPGSTNDKVTSYFAKKFADKTNPQEKLHALFAFIGAAYYEKCSNSEKILAALHKIVPTTYFCVGLAKLSPDPKNIMDLRFPQVDMQRCYFTRYNHQHPFSKYQEPNSALKNYSLLANADASGNEHQILKDIYQDSFAISTVKLLQIAHQKHKEKGLEGLGFMAVTKANFDECDTSPTASSKYFPHLPVDCLSNIKSHSKSQWDAIRSHIKDKDGDFVVAYITPGFVTSLDGYGLSPPSYKGIATLIQSYSKYGALISDNSRIMNGGYGSKLPSNFMDTINSPSWQLASNGGNYSFISSNSAPVFNGVSNVKITPNYDLPIFKVEDGTKSSYAIWNDSIWMAPMATEWKADVRQLHKSKFDVASDPVDIVTGAFYIDEVDLTLPGVFPLQIRRNYNSQNPLPNILGFGWKMSLNPILFEQDGKLYASEQDGTVIVYRPSQNSQRWIVHPDDNPELKNYTQEGVGGTSNGFQGYITKNGSEYTLHGADGSKRVFKDNRLITWSDHSGNILKFIYEGENLRRIENSSDNSLSFEYNHAGKISEVFAKDGRRILYAYDYQGNLSSVTLPNDAVITYEYDRLHRIIRETKPHGRILENVYNNNKVVEQRSPVGQNQQMVVTATFDYSDGRTVVIDGEGGTTEYLIHNKQIYKITDPEGYVTLQSWFLDDHTYFNAETETIEEWHGPGAYQRSLMSSKDKRGLSTTYSYDKNGNPTLITISGTDLTGNGDPKIEKHFAYNTHNLCILEDFLNTKQVTIYRDEHPYLPHRIESYVDQAQVSSVSFNYNSQGQIIQQDNNGAVIQLEYDQRGFPTTLVQKTGTDDPDVISSFTYNAQGQCIEQITNDAIICHEYDIMGNRYCTTLMTPKRERISQTYTGYDLNNQISWKQGDNPFDTIYFDYNAAGLLKDTRQHLAQIHGQAIESAGIAYTLYEYDTCGRLVEKVDPLGACTYNTYDKLGRLSSSTIEGCTTSYAYEPGGLIASVHSPGGSVVERQYTTNGLCTKSKNPDGTAYQCRYDLLGRPVEEVRTGRITTIEYNDAARTISKVEAGLTELYEHDARGNLIRYTDRGGYPWIKSFDALNRIKQDVSPTGEVTTWSYQGDLTVCTLHNGEKTIERVEAGKTVERKMYGVDGNLIHEVTIRHNPEKSNICETIGGITMTTWTNTLGLPVRIEQGDKVTLHHYDPCGRCIATVDGEKNLTQHEYDGLGRLARKILPDGAVIAYEYDVDSNLIAYHMPGGQTWRAAYDPMGRKITEWQEVDGSRFQPWEYRYENGLLQAVIDPQQRTRTFEYDNHGKMLAERVGRHERQYTYDPRGMVASAVEAGQKTSQVKREYDAAGRLVHEVITLDGRELQNTHQEWTPTGRALQIGEHTRHFSYEGGRLKGVSSNGLVLSYDHDASGALVKKQTPFSTHEIQYNASALPQSIETKIHKSTYRETAGWSTAGKLLCYQSDFTHSEATTDYSYTIRGFLQSAGQSQFSYDFDEPGNGVLTSFKGNRSSVDALGRVASEHIGSKERVNSYDESGQLAKTGNMQLSWDPWNRLVKATSEGYEWTADYDAFGRRLQTTYTPINRYFLITTKGKAIVTTSYYDPEHEFEEIGVFDGKKVFWKLHGEGSCDAVIDGSGNGVVLYHDLRSNLVAVISEEQVVWVQDYPSPYGPRGPPEKSASDAAQYALTLTWQSKAMDPTGLIWLGARYYDPRCGRFISPDPVSHPACLDLYGYANGDPINLSDLNGRFSSAVYDTLAPTQSATKALPTVKFLSDSQLSSMGFTTATRRFDLGDLNKPDLPNGLRITFANGIWNSLEDAKKSAGHLSELSGGHNIHGIYCAASAYNMDLASCILALQYVDTGRVGVIHEEWNDHFRSNPDTPLLHICHSRGAIDTRNALLMYPEDLRSKIHVVAIAPAAYIYRETCASVTHYRVERDRDWISYLDTRGAEREASTIVTLRSDSNAPYFDHTFLSPTYRSALKRHINSYNLNYGIPD